MLIKKFSILQVSLVKVVQLLTVKTNIEVFFKSEKLKKISKMFENKVCLKQKSYF